MEDHVFADLVTGFLHCVFKTGESFLCVNEVISTCDEADIGGLALADYVFAYVVHDLSVIGNDVVETLVSCSDADYRRQILSGSQIVYEFFGHTALGQCI